MSVVDTLTFIARHPLARRHRGRAFWRWARWQACKRLLPGTLAVPYVNDTRLLIAAGMTGATGNYYCGLHEFEDTAFVLHALRPGDLFIDVGANIGSYTLLAVAAGARTLSYEPAPLAFARLRDNVNLNDAGARVRLRHAAVGSAAGEVLITCDQDTMNHVIPAGSAESTSPLKVASVRLDDELAAESGTSILKVDVEGYEAQVLAGAQQLLRRSGLQAVILELNGSGRAFGSDDQALHVDMLERGFTACRYAPFERQLHDLNGHRSDQGNTLYVRDLPAMQARVRSSPTYRVAEVDL